MNLVLELIDEKRVEALEVLFQAVDALQCRLYNNEGCKQSFDAKIIEACTGMMLGVLLRKLRAANIDTPRPMKPFLGYSVGETTGYISRIDIPIVIPHNRYHTSEMCGIRGHLAQPLQDCNNVINKMCLPFV